MEEDKNTSEVENKLPFEEDGETTTEEISDEDDDGYGGRLRPLTLKYEQAIQDYDAKQKTCVEAGKIYMEATKRRPISDLDAKLKIYMEAHKECSDALFKFMEAHKELMWKQKLMDLSDHNEIIPLIPQFAECKESARAWLLGMIAKWEEELELLRVEAKEHQANQQRLVVEIAFAVSNANLTNGDIAKIASATSKLNLTNDTIAAKGKLLRQKREEFESSS